ncbi:23S rRNA (adenine(2503)-C(2))-methyltransferase RlmN, partial [Novosphingobium sp.]|uniref:23S rRNA (adenine(2503)-C(2))-methyltransferase RlmN n=2 Tax=unclassified Novosphingobium TaxID=2644732 RepID=UPI002634E119
MRAMQQSPDLDPTLPATMPIAGHIDPVPVPRPGLVDGVTPREDGRVDLIGLTKKQIAAVFETAGLDAKAAKLRAKQVFHWLYHRGVTDFEAMTDIAKTMRPWLSERFFIGRPEIVEAQVSSDGTRKWLLRTADGHDFEMVFIPDADRGTLCVSSQVGCTLNCRFCHTGTMRLVRNLTPGEIVGQVMLARDALGEWPNSMQRPRTDGSLGGGDLRQSGAMLPEAPAFAGAQVEGAGGQGNSWDNDEDEAAYTADGRLLTNIVMMGMGEPLYNFDNVRDALKLVMDGDGLALSKRRITLSTSGIVPLMARAGEEIGVNLAVSLHAVTKDVRDEIVPINRKYGIEEL